MLRLPGFQFIGELTDLLVIHRRVRAQFIRTVPFDLSCGTALVLKTHVEPVSIDTETVQPIAGGYNRFDKTFEAEVTEQLLHVFISGADLFANRFPGGIARKVETALFVKNRKTRIGNRGATCGSGKISKENAAETMNRRNRSDRQQSNGLHPVPRLRKKRSADSLTHFGCGFFRKRHGRNAERVD